MFSIFLTPRETDDSTAYRSGHWFSLVPGLLFAIMFGGPIFLFLGVLMFAVTIDSIEYTTSRRWSTKYYLSKHPEPFDIAKMNERCKGLGGYLVELNSRGEQKFLWKLIYYSGAAKEIVYTGLTDLGHEGRFYYYNSKKPMAGAYWRRRQPDNYKGVEHCTNLMQWGLNDIDCHRNARYVCEVPVR
ncbi:mannose receptor, c type 1-like 1 [Plakobranchus ocellatus]|uniref:Mannose receptor, c type 1-like 1 n=1 Tax=Plakobranchus ocellatus TaxID=259542 RepID=A0AAV4ACT0_9GAST|nr:mannose receptor, c type 1-like 1 [Plakobranchus ocellatus]